MSEVEGMQIIDGNVVGVEQHTVLGFDPGGSESFGWCIAQSKDGAGLYVLAHGLASSAAGVMRAVETGLPASVEPSAAGINAPLFWRAVGDRVVDLEVRRAIQLHGSGTPEGTAQPAHSLRGARLVQGTLIAALLRGRWPRLALTESHPNALREILPGVDGRLSGFPDNASKHERDAGLSALSAWAMVGRLPGWRDLFDDEVSPVTPLSPHPAYMMPNVPQKDPKS
jgi:hypothetical protein